MTSALQKPTAQSRLIDRIEKSLQAKLMRAQEKNDPKEQAEVMRLFLRFQRDLKETLAREGIR